MTAPRRAVHVTVAAFYAACSLLLTYPLVTHLATRLAGDNSDIWIFPWDAWWLAQAAAQGRDPLATPYLYFPYGASLIYHTLAAPLTAWSIVALPHVGLVALLNLVLLAALFSSALAAYALALRVTGSVAASLLAGVVYGFCPYRLDQARAHPDIVAGLWLPLFLLAGLSLLDARSARRGALAAGSAAVFAVLGLLTRPEYTVAGFALLGFLYLGAALRRRCTWKEIAARYAAVAACTAVLSAPYLLRVARAGPVPVPRDYRQKQITKSISLDRLIVPPRQSLLWSRWSAAAAVNSVPVTVGKIAFLGFALIALLCVGCVSERGSPEFWTWSLCGLFFLLVSLGPRLLLAERSTGIPLLYGWLPDPGVMRAPNRFVPVAMLCFAVAAALTWRRLSERVHRPSWRAALTLAVAALLLLEYARPPFPSTRPAVSPFYRRLAADGDAYAIAEVPSHPRWLDKAYMFYQTAHGKPIQCGHLSRLPAATRAYLESVPLLRALDRFRPPPATLDDAEVAADLHRLRLDGFRYLVFHKRFPDLARYPFRLEAREKRIAGQVAAVLGRPVYEDDLLFAFDLRAQADAARRDHFSAGR